jgi:hypothetical protein
MYYFNKEKCVNSATVYEKGTGYTALQVVVILSYIFVSIGVIIVFIAAMHHTAALMQLPFMILAYVWIYLFDKVAKAAFIARDLAIESQLRKSEPGQ